MLCAFILFPIGEAPLAAKLMISFIQIENPVHFLEAASGIPLGVCSERTDTNVIRKACRRFKVSFSTTEDE